MKLFDAVIKYAGPHFGLHSNIAWRLRLLKSLIVAISFMISVNFSAIGIRGVVTGVYAKLCSKSFHDVSIRSFPADVVATWNRSRRAGAFQVRTDVESWDVMEPYVPSVPH